MSKLRHLIRCITFISISAHANLASINYYPRVLISKLNDSTIALKDSSLKEELFKLLQETHKPLTDYKTARLHLFGSIDLSESDSSYYIKDRYCNFTATTEHGVGPGRIPNPNIMNCEHTWPQSRFTKEFPSYIQKNDLHHLYAVSSSANSSRSNLSFGEVDGRVVSSNCTESLRGVMLSNSSIKAFEPNSTHKGNVARAIFYFSTRYKIQIEANEEAYLRDWHKEDPVDQTEISRNDKVYAVQFDRNPFVDEPELVDRISDF